MNLSLNYFITSLSFKNFYQNIIILSLKNILLKIYL